VVTFLYLDNIKNPPASGPNGLNADAAQFASINQPAPPKGSSKPLNIKVNGQQYIWRYQYPGPQPLFSYYEMVVPTDTTVTLDVNASDVIHSWWIPKLGGKVDAVPGHTNQTWFKIKKAGYYMGQCAELCGAGHAVMHAVVHAVSPDEYVAWTKRQHAAILAAQKALALQRAQREKTGAVH
jgi:cytochrome c oxidase subunit 2